MCGRPPLHRVRWHAWISVVGTVRFPAGTGYRQRLFLIASGLLTCCILLFGRVFGGGAALCFGIYVESCHPVRGNRGECDWGPGGPCGRRGGHRKRNQCCKCCVPTQPSQLPSIGGCTCRSGPTVVGCLRRLHLHPNRLQSRVVRQPRHVLGHIKRRQPDDVRADDQQLVVDPRQPKPELFHGPSRSWRFGLLRPTCARSVAMAWNPHDAR